jgi:hypothetical protein
MKTKHTQHTKGPWTIENQYKILTNCTNGKEVRIPYYEVGTELRKIVSVNTGLNDFANAQLIAAAPEMLEALEHIQRELCQGEFVKHSKDAIRKIQDAIAKAGGEL